MDDNDFLAAVEADNEGTPVVEAVETPQQDTTVVVEAPEAEVLVLDTPAPPEPPKQDDAADGRLAALLDERDKRKALEAKLAQYEQRQQQQAQQVQTPDPYEDPEGFAAAQEARVSQALYQSNLQWSERIASMQHGEETVKAAKDWGFQRCETDPYFNAKVAASPDPVGFVVTEFKREEIASKVTPDEFAQFQAWKQAQTQLQQAAPAAPSTTASPIPLRSLASAPSAGSILTEPVQSDEEVFNEVIGKR